MTDTPHLDALRLDAQAALAPRLGWLVFAVALLPRLVHVWFLRDSPLTGQYVPDVSVYLYLAQKMLAGGFFFVHPMLMSPGYSLFITPILATLGPNVPALVLLAALLDAGSAVLCAGLATRIAPAGLEQRAGLITGLLYALCGPLLFNALLPLAEGPAIFCLLLGVTLLFRSPGGGNLRPYLGGLLFGLGCLLRPNMAPAALLLCLAWSLSGAGVPRCPSSTRTRLHASARFLLAMLLALLPFMAHNLLTEGRPTPFGLQGGLTFHMANFPGASGAGDSLPGITHTPYLEALEAQAEASRRVGRQLSLAESDSYWMSEGWRFFREQPGQAAAHLVKKSLLLLNEHGRDPTADIDFCRQFSPVPGLLALPVSLCFALGAVGLWRRAGKTPEAAALAVALLWGAASVLMFLVTPRYRTVLLPLVLCFAGCAVAELPALLRLSTRQGLVPALLFLTVLGLGNIPLSALVDTNSAAEEYARLGRYQFLTGHQPEARAAIDAALALSAKEQATPELELLQAMRQASLALEKAAATGRSATTNP
jgi:hypothetical protein